MHERVLVREQPGDRGDAEPVEDADVETEPGHDEQRHRPEVEEPRAPERASLAEAHRDRPQSLLAVDVLVKQRVEEVEAGHPERDRAAQSPGLPRQRPRDRRPRAHRGKPVHRPQPQVAEPRPALQVRVDHEAGDGDRPEPVHERVELEDGDEENRERSRAERHDHGRGEQPSGELAAGCARVARVEAGVDQPV
jgi:hypothetical protein